MYFLLFKCQLQAVYTKSFIEESAINTCIFPDKSYID